MTIERIDTIAILMADARKLNDFGLYGVGFSHPAAGVGQFTRSFHFQILEEWLTKAPVLLPQYHFSFWGVKSINLRVEQALDLVQRQHQRRKSPYPEINDCQGLILSPITMYSG